MAFIINVYFVWPLLLTRLSPVTSECDGMKQHTARSTRSTWSTQRQSQWTRQQISTHAERDYYNCPRCKKLFLRYHGSHKRHIRTCIAKYKALEQKERSQAEWIETPTPDPYTPIPTDAEMDAEDTATGS